MGGEVGTTYDVHLRLIGKCVVDFLLVLIEVFSPGVMAESLRAKRSKIGDFAPKFQVEEVIIIIIIKPRLTRHMSVTKEDESQARLPPPIIFPRLVRPMNALQLCR